MDHGGEGPKGFSGEVGSIAAWSVGRWVGVHWTSDALRRATRQPPDFSLRLFRQFSSSEFSTPRTTRPGSFRRGPLHRARVPLCAVIITGSSHTFRIRLVVVYFRQSQTLPSLFPSAEAQLNQHLSPSYNTVQYSISRSRQGNNLQSRCRVEQWSIQTRCVAAALYHVLARMRV